MFTGVGTRVGRKVAGLVNFVEAISLTGNLASFSATGPAANIAAALVPKGLSGVQGTTSGNARADYSVDWQLSRSNVAYVAAGQYSVIGGGKDNRTAGVYNTISGGLNNQLAGNTDYGFIGGGSSNGITNVGGSAGNNAICGGGSNIISSAFFNNYIGGGNANTISAGAYATISGGTINSVSGVSASIGGGSTNTASSLSATIPGGTSVTADGSYSHASGYRSHTLGMYGVRVYASGYYAASEYAQDIDLIVRATTTDATQATLTSDAAAASTTNQLVLLNSSAYQVEGQVIARQNTTGDCSAWKFSALVKRGANAAATAIVGSVTTTAVANDTNAATWALAVDADTTNGALRVQFTGEAAKTIRTTCTLHVVQTVG